MSCRRRCVYVWHESIGARKEETQAFHPEPCYVRYGNYTEAQAFSSFLAVTCLQDMMMYDW